MIYHDLIIVGGGASGLIAAIIAKDLGLDVALIEGTDRIGKKILTTGNGRCNISNSSIVEPFMNFHSENNNFFSDTLKTFTVQETINFFISLGLPIIELDKNKLYPQSLQASSVVDLFRLAIVDKNIPLYTNCKVKTIHKDKNFTLSTTNEELELFTCGKLILACGGKSAIKTGSDGSGFTLAKSLGHSIIPTLPGIVQLKCNYSHLKALAGVKFDGFASIIINNNVIRKEFGEILFTDYGLSGPPILQISSNISKALEKKCLVEVELDMFPNTSASELENFLYGHFSIFAHRTVSDALIGVINKKLIPIILKESGLNSIHIPCSELDWSFYNKLLIILKKWRFQCIGTNGFNSAQVTIGGINTTEVNPLTLESKLVKNLYFCGEILDVHGDCGGFNLQWAWSSGMKVANSIAKI